MKAYHLMKKFDNKQWTQALQKENMGQPILSLIQIYVNGVNREKNTAFDENKEKKIELFIETCIKYFKGLNDLKGIVLG